MELILLFFGIFSIIGGMMNLAGAFTKEHSILRAWLLTLQSFLGIVLGVVVLSCPVSSTTQKLVL